MNSNNSYCSFRGISLLILYVCTIIAMVQGHESDIIDKCPRGTYRKPTTTTDVTRIGDCKPCPRGRYGSTEGLLNSACTAGCPLGKFNDMPGAVSADDCKFCPPGTYGNFEGLTTRGCAARCPNGKFSRTYGATSSSSCISCFDQFNQWQCTQAKRQKGGVPVKSFLETSHGLNQR